MATGIEESILKKKIPGRYTSWEEDDSDEDDNNLNKKDRWVPYSSKSNDGVISSTKVTSHKESSQNTGVKGVLRDRRIQKACDQFEQERETEERQAAIKRMAYGVYSDFPSISFHTVREELTKQGRSNNFCQSDDDSYSSDDDEIMKSYRQSRFTELKSFHNEEDVRCSSSPWPYFGEIKELHDGFDFVDEVQEADPRVYVVIHLYEDTIPDCRKLNRCLEDTARKMHHKKFLRLKASRATMTSDPLDSISLPIIMLYKDDKLLHNLVRFTDELPLGFSVADLQNILELKGVTVVLPHDVVYSEKTERRLL